MFFPLEIMAHAVSIHMKLCQHLNVSSDHTYLLRKLINEKTTETVHPRCINAISSQGGSAVFMCLNSCLKKSNLQYRISLVPLQPYRVHQ